MRSPADIQIDIGELALDGVSPSQRQEVVEAMERELTRLLQERGLPAWLAEGGEVDRVGGLQLPVTPGSSARRIGGQLAQAIYQRLKG